MKTILIQIKNEQAAGIIHELEELRLIKILKGNFTRAKPKLSDKYRGIISKKAGRKLNEHINQVRSEWNNT